jgi:hypothetical protein
MALSLAIETLKYWFFGHSGYPVVLLQWGRITRIKDMGLVGRQNGILNKDYLSLSR